MKKIMMTGLVMSIAGWVGAAIITNNTTVGGFTQPWNSAMWGDPAAAPTAGNGYVKISGGAHPRGLGGEGSFNGDSLTIDPGGSFISKGGGGIGGFIYLNGGQWQSRALGTPTVLGNIRIIETSQVLMIDGGMQWSTGLGITSGKKLQIRAFNTGGKTFRMNALDFGVNGTIEALQTQADFTWDLDFMRSYSNATLSVAGGSDLRAAVYQLSAGENIVFKDVNMPAAGGGVVNLAPGTYNGAALATAGINSAYYNDLGGTIQVIPEPATLGMMGLAGLLALGMRRFSRR